MKLIFKPMILTMMFMALLLSCNNEELFVEEPITEVVDDTENDDVEDTTDDTENEDVDTDTSLPCDFDLGDVAAGETVIINCVMDLGGATINLPSDVTLLYEGGEIINGTLNFSNNTTLDGNLLNMTLTSTGSNPVMKDPVFEFVPERWGIVEGKVSDEVAYKNKLIINDIMLKAKALGASTIKIDALDAYFQTQPNFVKSSQTPQDSAIQVPSDIHLIMTEKTHLRTQPNNYKNTVLLTVFKGDNSIVEGGVLHGDRDTHDYSDGGTHEWGHLVLVKASKNVTIKNMTLIDAGGDGIDLNALGHAFSASYIPCQNVLITNNTIIRARRNGLSITDGRDIIVEHNEFIDSGVHTLKSEGTAPGFAIDVEAVRTSTTVYEIAQDIIIRNNIEEGSRVGGFTVHTGDRVTIENNIMENSISYSTSTGTIIRNNVLTAVSERARTYGTAITAGRNDRYERNYGNKVYGNTIMNFSTGIKVANTDLEVYGNEVLDCKVGIAVEVIINSSIINNKITSKIGSSDGIMSAGQSKYIDNVSFINNEIDVTRTPIQFVGINNDEGEEEHTFKIEKNIILKGGITISNSSGFNLSQNKIMNGTIRLSVSTAGSLTGNIIKSSSHGVRIDSGCTSINIEANNITVPSNFKCIWYNNTDAIDIAEADNICS